jgi:hypothetical protein
VEVVLLLGAVVVKPDAAGQVIDQCKTFWGNGTVINSDGQWV